MEAITIDSHAARRPTARWSNAERATGTAVRLDHSRLQLLRNLHGSGDGNAMLARFVGLFLEQVPSLLDLLHTALNNDDLAELRHAVHTLKSSCANLGAVDLVRYAEALEHNARRHDLAACAENLTALSSEYARVKPALILECNTRFQPANA